MSDPIKLLLQVVSVNDIHLDASGAIQRAATLTALVPAPMAYPAILAVDDATLKQIEGGAEAKAAAQAAWDAREMPADPNAVLGVPGSPHLAFTINLRAPELLGLFMQDQRFEVTLTPIAS